LVQGSIGYGEATGTFEACSCDYGDFSLSIADKMSFLRTKLRASRAAWGSVAYSHLNSPSPDKLYPLLTRSPQHRSHHDIPIPRGQFRRPKVATSDPIRSEVGPDASRMWRGEATPHTFSGHASWIHQQRERRSKRQTTLRPCQGHRLNYMWA
jgi:hypothetical protein